MMHWSCALREGAADSPAIYPLYSGKGKLEEERVEKKIRRVNPRRSGTWGWSGQALLANAGRLPAKKARPIRKAWANPSALGWTALSGASPEALPSPCRPRDCDASRGRWGSGSREAQPASISKAGKASACHEPAAVACSLFTPLLIGQRGCLCLCRRRG